MDEIEQLISGWRARLSATIQNPSTLDELENHLREEMERQQQSGLSRAAAFDAAVRHIGKPDALKSEFKKIGGGTLTADRMLGLLWFIYCAGSFYKLTGELSNTSAFISGGGYFPHIQLSTLFFVAVLMDVIYLRGLFASILLFGGHVRERRFIFFLAALDAVGGVVVLTTRSFHFLPFVFTIVGFITLTVYWPRIRMKAAVE